ncbi:VPLPA-CTERM sorting domain-containing protein [Puniceibacterium sediminis]|uniref:VPLPA-CTERM protein sorting domain-containing protein n=1 Tax=Puniceibacterium sediminis TaxID=1608407 RepID=A0A238Z448_9RHOB|nr:VPLPA-CTERM sorting domain-containing protein [Puniceibacterium sediminis]SNR78137.1 VPLPA-CTERM protein sorting domain-containing protein [Puniceibacterium sediminis]
MWKLLAAFVASQALALPAAAATLAGDTVNVSLFASFSWGSYTRTVGPGEDGSVSSQYFDFNAGPDGDLFTIRSGGFYCGLNCGGDTVVWTLTDLDFVDGLPLTDFVIVQSFSDATASFTDDSVTISYTDTFLPAEVYFQGRFVTIPPSAVPLPASLPLALAGLAGFGMFRKKRR